MKILHVLDHSIPLQSGYTFRSRAIIEAQRARGWETCHVTSSKHAPSEPPPAEEVVDGLLFYRTANADFGLANIPVVGQLAIIRQLEKRILEVAAKEGPDILHAHSPALNGVAAIRAGRKLGLPVVYEIRGFWEDAAVSHGTSSEGGLRYRLTRAMETWAIKHADAVTCICEGLRSDIVARGIAEQKVTIIPNAVDISRFTPVGAPEVELQQELGLERKRVIAFIGSFYDYEGLNQLVEAMPILLAERDDIRLLLVGGGQVAEELKQQVATLGLQDKVIMTGRVPYTEVNRFYALADILVYPRKSMRITELVTPLKPLEAMAQRSLFIASDVGGHKELVRDGETGYLFKADDVTDLANKVIQLLESEESWDTIRDAGRKFVEQERNWANSIARVEPVYAQMMQLSSTNRR